MIEIDMIRKGFTLMELLVAMGVLTLLMSLLVPALTGARQQSYAIQCSSNLHHLALSFRMYESEQKTFPYGFDSLAYNMQAPPAGYAGNPSYDRVGWWWFDFLADTLGKQIGDQPLYRCPSRKIEDKGMKENVLWGNYGVNQSICKSSAGRLIQEEFIGPPLTLDQIAQPSLTLLITDGGYSMVHWWHVTEQPPYDLGRTMEDGAYIPGLDINQGRSFRSFQQDDARNGRHPARKVNVGFADGHVQRVAADELRVDKVEPARFIHLNPLWRPARSAN